ncbi:MAG: NifU family protein [Treponema sp.]|mgnify:FL=1|nr:NifU family protein [Treponema sp.]
MVDPKIEEQVKEALEMFRPNLQADGGDMEYVGIDDENRVHLNLVGACGSCPMALMTLKMGVERYLKDAIPEITEVVQDNVPEGAGYDGMGGFGEF